MSEIKKIPELFEMTDESTESENENESKSKKPSTTRGKNSRVTKKTTGKKRASQKRDSSEKPIATRTSTRQRKPVQKLVDEKTPVVTAKSKRSFNSEKEKGQENKVQKKDEDSEKDEKIDENDDEDYKPQKSQGTAAAVAKKPIAKRITKILEQINENDVIANLRDKKKHGGSTSTPTGIRRKPLKMPHNVSLIGKPENE